MTICRKCGKEIPDGEELCEDCKSQETSSDESYLDELMKSIGIAESDLEGSEQSGESVMKEMRTDENEPEFVLDDIMAAEEEPSRMMEEGALPDFDLGDFALEDLPAAEEESTDDGLREEGELPDFDLGDIALDGLPPIEDAVSEEAPVEEELPVVEETLPEDEPQMAEELPQPQESESPVEDDSLPDISVTDDAAERDEINDLLDILSRDYADEEFDAVQEDAEQDNDVPEESVIQDIAAPELSLFSDDDSDNIFADSAEEAPSSVEDIFQDALSAVDYIGDDSTDDEAEQEDVFALGGDFDSGEEYSNEEEDASDVTTTVPLADTVKKAVPKKKRDSFWKKIFGNVITEQTAEEEEKERELEKADEEARAAAKEEKAKQAAEAKEAKAAAAQEEKEKKAALKAEKAAAKEAAKEEKKKKKAELAAVEVVGKINPVGATIVMVFFALICVAVILGTQSISYSSALKNAQTQFDNRDYEGAYEALAGVNVSESSQEMADKIRICMQLQKELNSYSNYYEMKMYLEALDSLVKGVRSYDANKDKADQYEILNQYNELESRIASTLFGEFGVSETEARSINTSETQEIYTAKLEAIIARWEAKNAEDER